MEIIKNVEEKELQEMTIEELKESLSKWKNLREFGPEMIEETQERIRKAEKEKKSRFCSKDRKDEIDKALNALQYVFMQTSKNIEISAGMIHSIEVELRLRIRQQMAEEFKKTL